MAQSSNQTLQMAIIWIDFFQLPLFLDLAFQMAWSQDQTFQLPQFFNGLIKLMGVHGKPEVKDGNYCFFLLHLYYCTHSLTDCGGNIYKCIQMLKDLSIHQRAPRSNVTKWTASFVGPREHLSYTKFLYIHWRAPRLTNTERNAQMYPSGLQILLVHENIQVDQHFVGPLELLVLQELLKFTIVLKRIKYYENFHNNKEMKYGSRNI